MTFEDLLQSLAHDGETVLTNDWRLLYNKATIYDCEVESTPPRVLEELPCGGAVLTNKRLLLMSASVGQGITRYYCYNIPVLELSPHELYFELRLLCLCCCHSNQGVARTISAGNAHNFHLQNNTNVHIF